MESLIVNEFQMSSKLAFVLESPMKVLPPYFDAWNKTASNVAVLCRQHSMRRAVDQMPVYNIDVLCDDHKALRLAHVQLMTMISGYIWCRGEAEAPETLPRCLAVPFWRVCCKLGIEPGIAEHAGLALANYETLDPRSELGVDNMRLLYFKFVDDPGNDWFFLVTTQIELDFAPVVPSLLTAVQACRNDSADQLYTSLLQVRHTIDNMHRTLGRMSDCLTPDVFFYGFRPYLAGTTSGVYEKWGGIVLEGVDTKPKKLIGGSAAQSATLQVLDAFLNVTHHPSVACYLQDVRRFLLPGHRSFIQHITDSSRVRFFVQKQGSPLVDVYNSCVDALVRFRSRHIQVVVKYITCPALRADSVANKHANLNQVGTGGTGIMPFLKSLRDSTASAKIYPSSAPSFSS